MSSELLYYILIFTQQDIKELLCTLKIKVQKGIILISNYAE